MAKYFINPFAENGDKQPIPDASQTDGSLSYNQGYTDAYEEDFPTDPEALPIPRQQYNQYLNDITGALKQYQADGFFPFITTALNGGFPYPYNKNAIVRYDPGGGVNLYRSLVNSNTALPTDTNNWVELFITPSTFDTINSSITLTADDLNKTYEVDCSGGNVTITMPTHGSATIGDATRFYKIDSSSNRMRVQGNGGQNIGNYNQHDFWGQNSWVEVTSFSSKFNVNGFFDALGTFFDVQYNVNAGQTITGNANAQRVTYSHINKNIATFWNSGTHVAAPTIPGFWRYDFSGGYDTRGGSQGMGRTNVTLQKNGVGVASGSQMNTRNNDNTANIFFYGGSVVLEGSQGTLDVVTSINEAGAKPFRSFNQDNVDFIAGFRGTLVKRLV